jgi:hypothetical protein
LIIAAIVGAWCAGVVSGVALLAARHRARVKAMWLELANRTNYKGESLTPAEIADVVEHWVDPQ